jgi:predicted small metal-binding protein
MKLLRCSDFGPDCPAEFRGATVEEVLEQAKRHGMEVHGQTAEQVDSEETMRIAAEHVREDDGS